MPGRAALNFSTAGAEGVSDTVDLRTRSPVSLLREETEEALAVDGLCRWRRSGMKPSCFPRSILTGVERGSKGTGGASMVDLARLGLLRSSAVDALCRSFRGDAEDVPPSVPSLRELGLDDGASSLVALLVLGGGNTRRRDCLGVSLDCSLSAARCAMDGRLRIEAFGVTGSALLSLML